MDFSASMGPYVKCCTCDCLDMYTAVLENTLFRMWAWCLPTQNFIGALRVLFQKDGALVSLKFLVWFSFLLPWVVLDFYGFFFWTNSLLVFQSGCGPHRIPKLVDLYLHEHGTNYFETPSSPRFWLYLWDAWWLLSSSFSWCLDLMICTIQNTTAVNFLPSVYENGARATEIPFPPSFVFDSRYEIHIFQHDDFLELFLMFRCCELHHTKYHCWEFHTCSVWELCQSNWDTFPS